MKTIAILLLSCLTLCAAPKSGKGKPKPPPPPTGEISLNASAWGAFYGIFNPQIQPLPNGQPGWWFQFPRFDGPESYCWSSSCPQVDYVYTWFGNAPLIGNELVLTYRVAADPGTQFHWRTEEGNTCPVPASIHLFIWKAHYTAGELNDPYGRWWSNPVLGWLDPSLGTVTIHVPLTPDQWSSVYGVRGSDALAACQSAFNNVSDIGITFGGGCFFGHGVYVSGGDAQFILTDYRVQ